MIGTLVMSSQRILFHAHNINTTDDIDNHKENDLSIDSSAFSKTAELNPPSDVLFEQ